VTRLDQKGGADEPSPPNNICWQKPKTVRSEFLSAARTPVTAALLRLIAADFLAMAERVSRQEQYDVAPKPAPQASAAIPNEISARTTHRLIATTAQRSSLDGGTSGHVWGNFKILISAISNEPTPGTHVSQIRRCPTRTLRVMR
jgi:hypothetical protein